MGLITAKLNFLSDLITVERPNKPVVNKKYIVITLANKGMKVVEFRGSRKIHLLDNLKVNDTIEIDYIPEVRRDKNGFHHQNNIGIKIERL